MAGGILVVIPRRLALGVFRRGLSLERCYLRCYLRGFSRYLGLDPKTVVESRLELTEIHLEAGRELADKDPIQATEKLYKATRECIKVLAEHLRVGVLYVWTWYWWCCGALALSVFGCLGVNLPVAGMCL